MKLKPLLAQEQHQAQVQEMTVQHWTAAELEIADYGNHWKLEVAEGMQQAEVESEVEMEN